MNVGLKTPKVPQQTVARVRRHWMTLAFFFGFVLDNLTLNRVDQVFDNLVLFSYVILAMVSLTLLYAGVADKVPYRWSHKVRYYAPLGVQFSFGGLLSGMLIFYGRSGAWAASWPFLLVILLAIYGNETIKDRAARLIYNLAILFIGLFSYVVLVIPVLTGYMGAVVFVLSGLLAALIMYAFVRLLMKIIPKYMALHMRSITFTLGVIFVSFNTLYFTNIIPPIPLSLKDVGIYHSVVRFENGDYQLKYEKGSWWQFLKDSDTKYHAVAGDNIFCFAKVFAPTKLETDIYHSWEYRDENTGEWIETAHLPYQIAGGRGDGFRGYTLIQNFRAGDWRCSVETKRGQVLGREYFEVVTDEAPNELVTRIE